MDVIDEKGRLFGVVNVVDALVVLVVLAMLVAGIALVMGGEQAPSDREPQQFATVAYAVPMGSDAASLSTGSTLNGTGNEESYAVKDVYRSFTPNGSVHVVATIGYSEPLTAGGSTVYGGNNVSLNTDVYRVQAQVLSVGDDTGTIPTTTRQVVLEANVSSAVANAIERGATATIGETDIATVTGVERLDGNDGRVRVLVGLELTAWDRDPVPAFDGSPLRVGNRLMVVTDTVRIPGHVAAVGTDDPATVASGVSNGNP